ncbi:hypothetical protein [Desertimonas flava]|uniref:hypothetical protein n=1 Tax=Desertimonas flava TaxID=2064846 RepID=UPI000E3468E4|nr:hypothetical protein [Desertimonas flava]
MIGDRWTTRAQAVVADAFRASLDAAEVKLTPRDERAVIAELADLLEALGWSPPGSAPLSETAEVRERRHQARRDRAAGALDASPALRGGGPAKGGAS